MTPFFPNPSLAAAYVVACLLLAATPGADMALFLSRTLAGGRAHGFAAQAGANVGLVVHTFAAALGLSALLAASAEAYEAVKIGGALYLLWLAWQAIRHGSVLKLKPDASARGGLRGAFANGLLINLTNPKIVLFFVTFLPQFISASDPHASMKLFVLGFGFIAITTLVNAIVVLVAGPLCRGGETQPARAAALRLWFRGAHERFRRTPYLERDEIGAPTMNLAAFRASLAEPSPPADLSLALKALWFDARGNWDGAHDAAQADEGGVGDWVHAYLHRKEGDSGNAAYWYRRARKPVCKTSLDEEWAAIAEALLKDQG